MALFIPFAQSATRRIRELPIDATSLIDLLRRGSDQYVIECAADIPEDARVVAMDYNPALNVLRLIVASDSFEEVLEGQVPRPWNITYRMVRRPEGSRRACPTCWGSGVIGTHACDHTPLALCPNCAGKTEPALVGVT